MNTSNTPERLNEIANKWRNGTATPQEKEIYEKWYTSFDDTEVEVKRSEYQDAHRMGAKIFARLMIRVDQDRQIPSIFKRYQRWFSAAAAILLFAVGYWIFKEQGQTSQYAAQTSPILPGKRVATLRLPNGQIVQLKEHKDGLVINASDLRYKGGATIAHEGPATNTQQIVLSTPKGGTYQVTLPDGSKVWLNALSSISIPADLATRFDRRLELKGEAYFEIARSHMQVNGADRRRPFIVTANNSTVQVLGTRFDVKSYAEEPGVRTTLLEGSVNFTSGKKHQLMLPGQRSVSNGQGITTTYVDVDEVIAWKNGNFQFADQKIQTIMHEIGRWYNVEVVYQGTPTRESFGGTISRNKPITEVLASLEETGAVHFKIEGRRVVVMP